MSKNIKTGEDRKFHDNTELYINKYLYIRHQEKAANQFITWQENNQN